MFASSCSLMSHYCLQMQVNANNTSSGNRCISLYPSFSEVVNEMSLIFSDVGFWDFQVKQIMEEAVTRKFVHEDSSHIFSFCGKLISAADFSSL